MFVFISSTKYRFVYYLHSYIAVFQLYYIFTLSKPLVRQIKFKQADFEYSVAFSINCRATSVAAVVSSFYEMLCCSSLMFNRGSNVTVKTLVKSFDTELKSEMP